MASSVPNDLHWIVGFDTPKLPQNPHEALRAKFEIFLRTTLNITPTQDDYIAVIEKNTAISYGSYKEAIANKAANIPVRFILGCWDSDWTVYELRESDLAAGFKRRHASADTDRLNINEEKMGTQIYPPVPAANGGAQQP